MTVDEAIQQKIENTLKDGKYCSETQAKDIARNITEEFYDLFKNDLEEWKRDVDRLRERQDRLWDVVHRNEELKMDKLKRWFSRLLFWRK